MEDVESASRPDDLPPEVLVGAARRDNEYGWTLSSFPIALEAAERFELACLGGQLQFRLENSIFEAYWCDADSSERISDEPWRNYVRRSCKEVRERFTSLVENLDLPKLASSWPTLSILLEGRDLQATLAFVAYFVTEPEYQSLE